MAYRPDEDSPDGVKIHLELTRWDVDVDPVLTTGEARELIEALRCRLPLIRSREPVKQPFNV
jgi:hypothetical protein